MDRRQLEVIEAAQQVLQSGGRAAMATVVRTGGSAPQVAGARMFLHEDGRQVGTVGGGRIEEVVGEELARCVREGTTHVVRWDLSKQLGMCCGGNMELLLEVVDGGPRLWIFGAGHIGQATARLASEAGFHVELVDEREELLARGDVPATQRHATAPDEAFASRASSSGDFMLVTTHDHRLDELALHAALSQPHRYVGMVASRRKTLRIVRRLVDRYGPQPLERLFAPVGLDLGGSSPQEIAIAIAAELVAVRHGREAAHARMDVGSVEGREGWVHG